MTVLERNLVAPAPDVFAFQSSSSPFDSERMTSLNSNVLEKISNCLEKISQIPPAAHGTFGNPHGEGMQGYSVASPKSMIRQLADMILPGAKAEAHYVRLHHILSRRVPDISMRRIRSIYNGECRRIWDEERDAIRSEIVRLESERSRVAFARAVSEISKVFSSSGCPLSAQQERALSNLVKVAA